MAITEADKQVMSYYIREDGMKPYLALRLVKADIFAEINDNAMSDIVVRHALERIDYDADGTAVVFKYNKDLALQIMEARHALR